MRLIALVLMLLLPLAGHEQSQQQPRAVAPKTSKIYVVGNVKKPGAHEILPGDQMTVITALARAEGTLAFSAKKAFIYRRNSGSDKSKVREEIPLDLSRILHLRSPDVILQADDILYIPSGKSRPLVMGIPVKGTPPFQIPIDWWQGS